MRYVEAQGLRASMIGLGAWQFGSPEWGWGDGFGPAEAQAIVDRARQLGVTLIDTAETYGKGESERVLGHILARPEQIALAWVVHRPGVLAIPGAKSVAQLESNAAAGEIVLADDEFLHLNQVADRFHRDTLASVSELVTRRARSLVRR